MSYSFSEFKKRADESREWLSKELGAIHTGRASIAFLDGIRVDTYGTMMPVNQLAGINIEDAKTIRITPWAHDTFAPIDRAIREANLGVSVATDDKGLRVIFPDLTGETREKYVKIARKKLEEARISLRNARDEVWNDIQSKEKDSTLGEDEKFRAKEDMEKIVKETNDALDQILKGKETEIMN